MVLTVNISLMWLDVNIYKNAQKLVNFSLKLRDFVQSRRYKIQAIDKRN